ncbi:MAG: YciI family protein [Bacteriovoracaceae bacterium]
MKRFVILLCALTTMSVAQDSKKIKEDAKVLGPVLLQKDKIRKEVKDGEMKQYFLVLLKRGPIRNQDSTTAAELQKGHLANIDRLYKEGKIDLAGPMGYDGDLRGIFVFNCETYDEVLNLCATDPSIKAGRLTVEIYSWWSAKGAKLR